MKKGDSLKERCSLCGGVLVVRQNSKDGSLFVGCRSFPSCTMNRPLRDDEDEGSNSSGFKDSMHEALHTMSGGDTPDPSLFVPVQEMPSRGD